MIKLSSYLSSLSSYLSPSCPNRKWLRQNANESFLVLLAYIPIVGLLFLSQTQFMVSLFTSLRKSLGIPKEGNIIGVTVLPPFLFIIVWSSIFLFLAHTIVILYLQKQLTYSRAALLALILMICTFHQGFNRAGFNRIFMLGYIYLTIGLFVLGSKYLVVDRKTYAYFLFMRLWGVFASGLSLSIAYINYPHLFPAFFASL